MTTRRRFRAMLFDVDGTLIDSNDAHARAWIEALGEHGVVTDVSRIRPLIGMGGDKLLPEVAHVSESSKEGKAIAERKKEIFHALLGSLRPTRGARELLRYLRDHDVALAIATSADDKELAELLEQAGLDEVIPTKASKDDAQESKPDPDIVHAALVKAGALPHEAIMVGDTPYDIEAASHAGVAPIALRCGGYWSDDALKGAVALYDDPQDLLAHWKEAGSSSR
jgi:HAD superfamily hydrolase (TIGR01549 family)